MPNQPILKLAVALTLLSSAALTAPAADADRLRRLEEAVRILQSQNAQLTHEIRALKHPAVTGGECKAGVEAPTVVVKPAGPEVKLVLGGFIQANGDFGNVSAFEGRFPGLNQTKDRFRLRRARINVSGEFAEDFDFKLEGDFALGDGLASGRTAFSGTDIFINWHHFPEANIKVGQWKAPFGLEQLTPDTTTFVIERGLPTGEKGSIDRSPHARAAAGRVSHALPCP